jgi:hypothetical protein
MRNLLILILFIGSNTSYAFSNCLEYKSESYSEINKNQINLKDQFYSDIPYLLNLEQRFYRSDILKLIKSNTDQVLSIKVTCMDEHNIFFSAFIVEQKVDFMDGFIYLESDRYYSGPHSLVAVDSEVVIIQADRKVKPNKKIN